MNDILLQLMQFRPSTKGLVVPTPDGDYIVFVNSVYNAQQQKEIFNHEVRHLLHGHHHIEGRALKELEASASDANALLDKIQGAAKHGLPVQRPVNKQNDKVLALPPGLKLRKLPPVKLLSTDEILHQAFMYYPSAWASRQ